MIGRESLTLVTLNNSAFNMLFSVQPIHTYGLI